MNNLVNFLIVTINIYLPVNAWLSHDNNLATPLSYIGLGFSLYFWLLVLLNMLTPKSQRKIYSQQDLEDIAYETNRMLELETSQKEETKH